MRIGLNSHEAKEYAVSQDEKRVEDEKQIKMDKAVELLFNDSSKNVSDLKSRQWTATNLSVLAIMAIAVFAHQEKIQHPIIVTLLMFLIVLCHVGVTIKCHRNLDTFRSRIKTLISCYFPEESHKLFEKGKKAWVQGQEFEDAVVDEGSIETMLFATTPVTFVFACFVVWCWH